ncbi:MAG: hypothetical protein U9532_00005 ['Conium maculatum' witches'-broom phytoplasma]|nr:hypothetical protein ['Conium maculatum' witches'-broom phytoplasma]
MIKFYLNRKTTLFTYHLLFQAKLNDYETKNLLLYGFNQRVKDKYEKLKTETIIKWGLAEQRAKEAKATMQKEIQQLENLKQKIGNRNHHTEEIENLANRMNERKREALIIAENVDNLKNFTNSIKLIYVPDFKYKNNKNKPGYWSKPDKNGNLPNTTAYYEAKINKITQKENMLTRIDRRLDEIQKQLNSLK